MDANDEINFQLSSSEWYLAESDKLLKEYQEAKTEFARLKLLPKVIGMFGKLNFQKKEMEKYIPPELLDEYRLNNEQADE